MQTDPMMLGPVVALVGDLAFLHDTNALLGAASDGGSLTVVVVAPDSSAEVVMFHMIQAVEAYQ